MKKNTEEKMVQKRRVVITGLGAVTPIGNTVPEFWTNVRKGTVGIGEITGFDTKDFKVKLAAQVKDFHGEEKIDAKAARRMELFSQYAVAAAKEALEDAGLDLTKEDLFRAGVIVGSGIGSLSTIEKEYTKILEGRANRVDPYTWKMHQCCNGMCFRNKLHRRRIPRHSVWGCGDHVCRRSRKLYLSDRYCRISGSYGAFSGNRSAAGIHSL